MRKGIFVFVFLAMLSLLFVSCCHPAEDSPEPKECKHAFVLQDFSTEQSEIPYAARFRCEKCDTESLHSFSFTDIDIPLVSITGDLSAFQDEAGSVWKDRKIDVGFRYQSKEVTFEGGATLKIQGKSSSDDPKNNYSVNLLDAESGKKVDLLFDNAWGKGNKYVLKANYVDPSGVRNVALSSLYGQMAHERDLSDRYASLVNCGAVDGYPVLLYVNGQYHGLYNWVIRKDKWLYGMGDESAPEAVLDGSDMGALESEEGVVILPEGAASAKSWKEEYVNENYGEKGWAEKSFNQMLFAIKGAEGDRLRDVIAEYTETERLLDVLLFNCVFGNVDSVGGNQVWCTFDGVKWAPVPYDYDRALGRNGNCLSDPDEPLEETIALNPLYAKIIPAFFDEIAARYAALRKGTFTVENVMALLREKLRGVDDRYFRAELGKWQEAPWRECEGSEEITGFEAELRMIEAYLTARFVCCDAYFLSERA